MTKTCETCQRWNKKYNYCEALTSPPNPCWAWTDDPEWEAKVNEAVMIYKMSKLDNCPR